MIRIRPILRRFSQQPTVIGEEFKKNTKFISSPPPVPVDSPSLRSNFDSTSYVEMLKSEGFSETEAIGLVSTICDAVEESVQNATETLATKSEQRKHLNEAQMELLHIRKEVANLEQKDFAMLKTQIEEIKGNIEKTKANTREEVSRVHSGVRLDINLEVFFEITCQKSRIQLEAVDLSEQLKAAEERIDEQMDKLEARMKFIKSSARKGTQRILGVLLGMFLGYRIVGLISSESM
jgi:tetrahydromethanopterin S-methyltransferase subunit B